MDKNKTEFRKPKRYFEDAGAVYPGASYYVPLENIFNKKNQDIKTMVNHGRYFSMFAPRQSGKTTFQEEIRDQLHKDDTYVVILLNFERYKSLSSEQFYHRIQEELYPQLIDRLTAVNCQKIDQIKSFLDNHPLTGHLSFNDLFLELNRIIEFKKIIIFIDEFDGIPLDALEDFLTTLRYLYQKSKRVEQKALYSVGLVGIRNITKLVVGGVSPFNIADRVQMKPFSQANIRDLYAQYTEETNQPFTEDAIKRVHRETGGQTWLVNRLGTILTVNVKPGTVEPINEQDVEKAIEILLNEKNSHFDNLYEKAKLYKETFIQVVFGHADYVPDDEDQSWLEQYGLIKNKDGQAVVATNIYKSRFLKAFFRESKAYEEISPQLYELPGGKLDMKRILLNFETYIMEIGVGAFYREGKPYEKTGQFLLTAWLYQFARGGAGELRYEVKSGIGRMDILLTYKSEKYIIETKINRYKSTNSVTKEGIQQLTGKYMASENTNYGYLVIFDVKTPVGTLCKPKNHKVGGKGNKTITSFIIGIGEEA